MNNHNFSVVNFLVNNERWIIFKFQLNKQLSRHALQEFIAKSWGVKLGKQRVINNIG